MQLSRGIAMLFFLTAACCGAANAQIQVAMEWSSEGFRFPSVPSPVSNDQAEHAKFRLIDGRIDANSKGLEACHDGRLPSTDDQPNENFFFAAGTNGGLVEIDLGSVISIRQIATYAWHTNSRAPQVYKLYGADGESEPWNRQVKKGDDLSANGWKFVASIDSRSIQELGGQHGVCVSDKQGALGRYRYLLLDFDPTERADNFGNTFFSEIDVYEEGGAAPEPIPVSQPALLTFDAAEGKYHFSIDTTHAPDLTEWTDNKLRPVVQTWYPKIVQLLPSDGFTAPSRVTMRFLDGGRMAGVPAYATGSTIVLNATWFRNELEREARGAVVHEMVHVVQRYSMNRRNNNAAPGWVVEGIPDYIRWYLYEPESKGATIRPRDLDRAQHDASYRTTANFLDYLTHEHDKDIIVKLNAAARAGRYDKAFWKTTLGKSTEELEPLWKAYRREELEKKR